MNHLSGGNNSINCDTFIVCSANDSGSGIHPLPLLPLRQPLFGIAVIRISHENVSVCSKTLVTVSFETIYKSVSLHFQ